MWGENWPFEIFWISAAGAATGGATEPFFFLIILQIRLGGGGSSTSLEMHRVHLIFMFVVTLEYAASGQEGRATSLNRVWKRNEDTWESTIGRSASINDASHGHNTGLII